MTEFDDKLTSAINIPAQSIILKVWNVNHLVSFHRNRLDNFLQKDDRKQLFKIDSSLIFPKALLRLYPTAI